MSEKVDNKSIIKELVGYNLGGYVGSAATGFGLHLGSNQAPWPPAAAVDVNGFDVSGLEQGKFYKLEIYKKTEIDETEAIVTNPTEEDDADPSKTTYVLLSAPVLISNEDVRSEMLKCAKSGQELWDREVIFRTQLKEKIEAARMKDVKIPEIPADLCIEKTKWAILNATLQGKKNVMLLGPKGTGKTETAKQLAAANDAAYFTFNMGAAFKPKQLFVGQLHAKQNDDGNVETVLFESEFLKAFQAEELTYIFLDEITRTPAGAANYLMTITDLGQGYIYIEELGKRIYKGKGVRFISAGNVGNQYVDTRTQDIAFWDRFSKMTVDYLPFQDEVALLMKKVPNLNKKGAEGLVKIATKTREAHKDNQLSNCLSLRQLIDGGDLLAKGFTLEKVIDEVLINNFINGNIDERDTAKGLMQGS